MKLVRFGPPGRERPGIRVEGPPPRILDVRAMAFDIATYDRHFFLHHGLDRLRALLAEPDPVWVAAGDVRLGPPVCPGQIIAVGKNYADHAREFGGGLPERPLFFSKSPTALTGHGDPIELPPDAGKVDAEVELAVVVGRDAGDLSPDDALSAVAGYTVLNDVSDRTAQRTDGQWFRAKSAPTFCPVGPWLVTPDEFGADAGTGIRSRLNGEPLQAGTLADLVFSVPELLSTLSRSIELQAGDILATGTPAGVGSAQSPPRLLRDGDRIEVEIDGIGCLANPVTGSRESAGSLNASEYAPG